MFELEENVQQGANIKVVGVGGGGNNAVQTMIEVDFKALSLSLQIRINRHWLQTKLKKIATWQRVDQRAWCRCES